MSHLCHVESEENSSEKLFILFYNIFTSAFLKRIKNGNFITS
ncbi:hypothetical protein BHF72_1596 [Cloacibacterium normanense]|uniref:Uncharacterized protein n=1 Tax=Cloacibacterium normanense TaxID=237258 RepID=A0A1E5UGS5_9FLAO|nr:hypothetical protein BHF72_1596 [Cloacibacterium normanense]